MHRLDEFISGHVGSGAQKCYYRYHVQLYQEFSVLPVQIVKNKLHEVSQREWSGSDDSTYGLKLLLNARTKYVTLEKIRKIFDTRIYHCPKNDTVNNLATFAIFLDDACIDYLLDPATSLGPNNTTSVYDYLTSLKDGDALGRHLRALKTLCEFELTSLLIKRYLFVGELGFCSKNKLRVIFEILENIPAEQHSRELVLKAFYASEIIPNRNVYEQFLCKHSIKLNSQQELAQLILLPHAESIPESSACAQLIQTIGMQNFIIFARKELNLIPVIFYLNKVSDRVPEKFPGLLTLIRDAFLNNQVEQLPELMNAYLFSLVPAVSKQLDDKVGSKRIRSAESTDENIRNLCQKAESEPELARRLFDAEKAYSESMTQARTPGSR